MILFFAIDEEDRDIERRSSEHVQLGKFFLRGAIAFAILLLIFTPVYLNCRQQMLRVVTQENLRTLFQGVSLYADANNEGLPPLYERAGPEMPVIDRNGNPIIWATHVMGYVEAYRLRNPKTPQDSQVRLTVSTTSSGSSTTYLGYGMASSLDTTRLYDITNKDSVLFAETTSGGRNGSLNPLPLAFASDGFMIGFDDTNLPGAGPTRDSQFATRLAFSSRGGTNSISDMEPLHEDGTLAISADGRILYLKPSDQIVQKAGTLPTGLWAPFR